MKCSLILITLFILIGLESKAQIKIEKDLFLCDSVPIYIGIINKFKITPDETITQIGTTKGVNIKINNDLIEIRSYYKGTFNIEFKSPKGIKRVVLISQLVNRQKKK